MGDVATSSCHMHHRACTACSAKALCSWPWGVPRCNHGQREAPRHTCGRGDTPFCAHGRGWWRAAHTAMRRCHSIPATTGCAVLYPRAQGGTTLHPCWWGGAALYSQSWGGATLHPQPRGRAVLHPRPWRCSTLHQQQQGGTGLHPLPQGGVAAHPWSQGWDKIPQGGHLAVHTPLKKCLLASHFCCYITNTLNCTGCHIFNKGNHQYNPHQHSSNSLFVTSNVSPKSGNGTVHMAMAMIDHNKLKPTITNTIMSSAMRHPKGSKMFQPLGLDTKMLFAHSQMVSLSSGCTFPGCYMKKACLEHKGMF